MSDSTVEAILNIGGLQIQPGDRIGPYIYRSLVGKGGMANVLLATDPSGQAVALKVLKSNRIGTGLTRFKREFRALARLQHPNVIRVDAYGDIHGHPYIAMEYVEGTDLHHVIHGFRDLSLAERWVQSERILIDLCRALAYIHRRGLIHRDLKPSNVLINQEGVCKLTDFGIVKDLDPNTDAMLSTTLVGTWAYASPEQIAGQAIDHRSDLYSLGVILFAMLTGRRPFVAKDLAGYLELHKIHAAPGPSDIEPGIPSHLDAICRKLLKKLPKDRFRSAQEILYRLERRSDALPLNARWQAPLVGRIPQEELLRERIADLTRGQGSVVVIEGPEGCGRSRMLSFVADQGRVLGLPVFEVAINPQEPPQAPLVRLSEALGLSTDPSTPRERLAEGLLGALRHQAEDGPLVLLLDDVHLASATLADILQQLLRPLSDLAVLVVLTLQPDHLPHRLAVLREGRERVVLGPLLLRDVEQVVESLVGAGKPANILAQRLFRETEGNALFLSHYLHNLMGRGLLQRSSGNSRSVLMAPWKLMADPDEISTGHLEIPAAVRRLVHNHTEGLSETQHAIAEVLAVQGQQLELDTLLEVLDMDEEIATEAIERMESSGLIRSRESGEQVYIEMRHGLYTDVIYRDLDDERRALLHRTTAEALEARFAHAPGAAELVGEHYRRAGDAGKAFHYLGTAATRALERGLTHEAQDLVNRAQLSEDAARVDLGAVEYGAIKRQMLEVRAEVAQIRGEWTEARELLEAAVIVCERANDEAGRLRVLLRLSRVLRRLGQLLRAEEIAKESLSTARERHDRESVIEGLLTLSTLAWSRGDLERCEALAQEGLVLASGGSAGRARASLLLSLTSVQANRGQLASAASGLSEAVMLSKELRDKSLRTVALVNLAEVLLGQGDAQGAWTRAEEAFAVAKEIGHRLAEAAVYRVQGMLLAQLGQHEEARTHLNKALSIAKNLSVPQEICASAFHLARVCLEQGALPEARKHLKIALDAVASGDPERYRIAIDVEEALVLALEGQTTEARQQLDAVGNQHSQLPALRRAEVTLDLARSWAALGDVGPALTTARAALHLAGVRGFRLLVLEGLAFTIWFSTDFAEKERLSRQMAEAFHALVLPESWAFSLRTRLGLS